MVKYRYIIRAIETEIKCQTTGANIKKGVREALKNFHNDYGLLDHEEAEIYDKNGNLMLHDIGDEGSVDISWDKLVGGNYDNLHLTHNHPTFHNDLPCFFSYNDMHLLLMREYDGKMTSEQIYGFFGEPSDYIIRSVTACNPNGSSATIIRTNDFPGKYFGHEDAEKIFKRVETVGVKYNTYYKNKYKLNIKNALKNHSPEEKKKLINDSGFRRQISRQTLNELGDLDSFLEKENVYSDLEKIGCKLEINKPKIYDENWMNSNNWELSGLAES